MKMLEMRARTGLPRLAATSERDEFLLSAVGARERQAACWVWRSRRVCVFFLRQSFQPLELVWAFFAVNGVITQARSGQRLSVYAPGPKMFTSTTSWPHQRRDQGGVALAATRRHRRRHVYQDPHEVFWKFDLPIVTSKDTAAVTGKIRVDQSTEHVQTRFFSKPECCRELGWIVLILTFPRAARTVCAHGRGASIPLSNRRHLFTR